MLIILGFSTNQLTSAQKKSDIGILGGISYYMGDINPARHFYMPSFAGGILWRYNFNLRNSIRVNGMYANLKGEAGGDYPYKNSPHEAFNSGLLDIGITTEFNFLPYQATKIRRDRYTPYVSGGIGYTVVLGGPSSPGLSFAGGFKYNVTTRLSAGAEWSFRKTFNDELDGLPNPGLEYNVFFHNKDWYSIVGIFVTYKIFDWGLDCPAYEQ